MSNACCKCGTKYADVTTKGKSYCIRCLGSDYATYGKVEGSAKLGIFLKDEKGEYVKIK